MTQEPLCKTEQSLENALVEAGVPREKIQFGSTFTGKYIRVGYWMHIDNSTQIDLGLSEDECYDDDTGWKYCYFY